MRRQVLFYRTRTGVSPNEEFLDSLPGKVAQKIMWVLSIIEEFDVIPAKYFKKIDRESNIYESRIDFGGNTYRLLSFFFEGNFIVLSNGFMKKTKKIPKDEITVCIRRMRDFVNRGGES